MSEQPSGCPAPDWCLIEFHVKTLEPTMWNFILNTHWRQHPKISCSCARKRPPVSTLCCDEAAINVKCICAIHASNEGGTLFLITVRPCEMSPCAGRSGIQLWQEREGALPFVTVWLTHAIPHICSISERLSEGVFSSHRRLGRSLGWSRCLVYQVSVP